MISRRGENRRYHEPVLCSELVALLPMDRQGVYVDVTAGYGGHARVIAQKMDPSSTLVLLDRDPEAVRYLQGVFVPSPDPSSSPGSQRSVQVVCDCFSHVSEHLEGLGLQGRVMGLYADLGVSSPQLDQAHRGFSFQADGPLDMRMNRENSAQESAAEFLAYADEKTLVSVFRTFGEEPKAAFIARAIIKARQRQAITRTSHLAQIVCDAVHDKKPPRRHPATRVFQALRIHVNDELAQLQALLQASYGLLAEGGVFVVIAFHSLEDRMVKRHFQALADPHAERWREFDSGALDMSALQVRQVMEQGQKVCLLKPFPQKPSTSEQERNPRSRSARLRAYRKTALL